MKRLSIKESLKLLTSKNSREEKPKTRKTNRSPIKIPVVTPVRNELKNRIEEEYEENKNLYTKEVEVEEEVVEKEEVEEKIILKSPHTPVRFKIESPRTPVRKFNQLPDKSSKINLYDKLKDKRYTLLKYIILEEENKLIYVVCYDPNGQILFVQLDENFSVSIEEKNIINVKKNEEDFLLDAFQNAVQERMITEVQGIVFYNGNNYLFCLHQKNGSIRNYKYDIINYQDNKKLVICETFTVVNLREIEKETTFILDITKKNYQLIQQQQQLISTNTTDNIITSVNSLSNNLKKFIDNYKKYTNNIIDDWGFLGTVSLDYYEKYGQGKLTETEKENFDKVSINMFARFQAFNQQLMLVNKLNDIIPDIDKASQIINKITEEIEINDNNMSGNIIEMEDLNISI